MIIANIISLCLVLVGAINWGIIGIFNFNVVSAIFGAGLNIGSSIIYILVALAGLYLIYSCIYFAGNIPLVRKKENYNNNKIDM